MPAKSKDSARTRWLLGWTNAEPKPLVLSKECTSALNIAAGLFRRIDRKIAREYSWLQHNVRVAAEIDLDALFSIEEIMDLNTFAECSDYRDDPDSDQDALRYLNNLTTVHFWDIVRHRMSDFQNRIIILKDEEAELPQACRERAWSILEDGERILKLLEPMKIELNRVAPDVLLSIDTRLSGLYAFSFLADFHTDEERKAGRRHEHVYPEHLNQFRRAPVSNGARSIQKWNATLIALTLIFISISIVPLSIAWKFSPTSKGSTRDAGFWTQLQNFVMQLLSLVTIMLPVSRFQPSDAWIWSWVFAASGTLFAIAAPVAFVYLPVAWSGLFGFFSAVSQAAILLQLMGNVQPATDAVRQKTD